MKKLLFSVAMLAMVAVSCDKNDESGETLTKEPMTISVSTDGLDINYSPLSMSRSTTAEDLLAVQVYSGDQPVAKGLVRDWSNLSFAGFSNTEYTVVATMLVDATEVITESGGTYALPFNAEIVDNLEPSSEAFESLELSTATLANHSDTEYSTPDITRYFGEQSKTVTKSSATITTQMKCMSFGVSFDGIDEDITLTIAGAPTVTLSIGELAQFSFNDIEAAYTASESSTPYTETMDISVTYKGVTTDYEGVVFQRNMEAEIEYVDGGFNFEFEESGIIRVLTFEDDDYKAGETTSASLTGRH